MSQSWADKVTAIKTTYFNRYTDDEVPFLSTTSSPLQSIGYQIQNLTWNPSSIAPYYTYDGISYSSTSPTSTTLTTLKDVFYTSDSFMSGLYMWYAACSADNWANFKNGTYANITYPKYVAATSVSMAQSDSDKAMMNAVMKVDKVVSDPNFNPFVARRLLRLYILMGNLSIAIKNNNPDVTKLIYGLLNKANRDITNSGGVVPNLSTVLQKKITQYNADSVEINALDTDVRKRRDELLSRKQMLADTAAVHTRQRRLEYIAVITFLLLSSAGVGIVVFPGEPKQKYIGCAILVLAAIINAFVLTTLKARSGSGSRYREGFAGTITDGEHASDTIADYTAAAKEEALKYLDNTVSLTMLLATYRAYGNINHSMKKEIGYFSDSSEQLLIAGEKVKGAYDSGYMQDVQFAALTNFLISLSIIVAGVTSGYVASNALGDAGGVGDKVRTFVLGAGGVFAAIALILFILEMNGRVHTSPKKLYWAQPVIH